MSCKVFVDILASWTKEGKILPRVVKWEDGTKYRIDKILDIRRAASLKAGGAGIRYTVRIGNRETYLFLEDDKWFVESRE